MIPETETVQPMDTLMNELSISNADLVKASTEQLTFKMVQKGRRGRRLTPNVQDKIIAAFAALKPELHLRRRDLFRYESSAIVVEQIQNAIDLIAHKKINYPQYVDLLALAGLSAYTVDVARGETIFFGTAGEAHTEQGPALDAPEPGSYDEPALKSAIADAQKEKIDYPAFLKRIYAAGISSYEVNLRKRRIDYKGEGAVFREPIPAFGQLLEAPAPAKEPEKKAGKPAAAKPAASGKAKAKIKSLPKIRKGGKLVMKHRAKKRMFVRKKKKK